jgi:cell division protein ZapE
MDKLWLRAGGQNVNTPTLEINHRPLPTLGVENQTLAVSLRRCAWMPAATRLHCAFAPVPHRDAAGCAGDDALMESEARRFIALVDEFYERHVKLVVSAAVPLYEIYQGERLKFEFQRCLSRLQEMQSEEYLKLEHMP